MRKLLLFTSLTLFISSILLFVMPTNIPNVELCYTITFILSLVLLAIADYMKFKISNNMDKM